MSFPDSHRAYLFASGAHAGHGDKRKYTGEDYIVHPTAVARILRSIGASDAIVAAAYLHDVVEDTDATEAHLRLHFGERITSLVLEVTDTETGNRKQRKDAARDRLAAASADAQTLKLADLIDNTKSIVKFDPDFARVYLAEKEALLAVLTKGDARLHRIASDQVLRGLALLAIS